MFRSFEKYFTYIIAILTPFLHVTLHLHFDSLLSPSMSFTKN